MLAALELILLGFIGYFNTLVTQLPNCVFAGASICCYGLIGSSAIKLLKQTNIDFDDTKTIWIFAIMLMLGTSGVAITYGTLNISGICLAIIIGIIVNAVFKRVQN